MLVLGKYSGEPGEGAGEFGLDEQVVYDYNWYGIIPPTPEEFEEVMK